MSIAVRHRLQVLEPQKTGQRVAEKSRSTSWTEVVQKPKKKKGGGERPRRDPGEKLHTSVPKKEGSKPTLELKDGTWS